MELTKQEKIALNVMNLKLIVHFGMDYNKVGAWYETKNPQLGGISPAEMIHTGRLQKLREFVETSIQENERKEQGDE